MTDGRAAAVSLRFEILGEVRALRGTEPLDLGPAKQRAVLAVLLLHAGRPVPVPQIVDAVWGDDPPENGANVVQKYVAGLRRVLDPDRAPRTPGELLALTGSGYVLRTAEASVDALVDADEFRAAVDRAAADRRAGRFAEAAATLSAGLRLWRGEALAGLSGPAFDAARSRLAEARATAWEKWADIELARGRDTTLIPDLVRLVEEFPLREGLRAQLMIALHQGGRQAEALAAFRDAREFFLDQFGAEPGDRMRETHQKILRGEAFYTEPVDPWAESASAVAEAGLDAIPPQAGPGSLPAQAGPGSILAQAGPGSIPAQAGPAPVSGAPTERTPTPPPFGSPAQPFSGPPAQPYSGPPSQPFTGRPVAPPQTMPARGGSVLEIVLAILLPLVTCSFAGWIYFLYAALRHRDRRHYIAVAIYGTFWVVGIVLLAINPTPTNANDLSGEEWSGLGVWTLTGLMAAVHGGVVAAHGRMDAHVWALRDQARQFAAFAPDRALRLGIGQPGVPRTFDDGGLIDLNHVPGAELARAARLSMSDAHRIVTDRHLRGPFQRPEDLVARGLVSARTVRRLHGQLICIPPVAGPPTQY